MDGCGTAAESKAFRSGLFGLLWTPVDTAWRSTDKKVGVSSPSGRATETLLRGSCGCVRLSPMDVGDPIATICCAESMVGGDRDTTLRSA